MTFTQIARNALWELSRRIRQGRLDGVYVDHLRMLFNRIMIRWPGSY